MLVFPIAYYMLGLLEFLMAAYSLKEPSLMEPFREPGSQI